jgi:hypothetical protein
MRGKHGLSDPNIDPERAYAAGLASANPLLANITDYLIEEANAEEEELLGKKEGEGEEGEEVAEGETLVRDDELIKVGIKLC